MEVKLFYCRIMDLLAFAIEAITFIQFAFFKFLLYGIHINSTYFKTAQKTMGNMRMKVLIIT